MFKIDEQGMQENWNAAMNRPLAGAEMNLRRGNIPFDMGVGERIQAQPIPWPENIPVPAPVPPEPVDLLQQRIDELAAEQRELEQQKQARDVQGAEEEMRDRLAARRNTERPMFLAIDSHGDGVALYKHGEPDAPDKAYIIETASDCWDEDGDADETVCVYLTQKNMKDLAVAMVANGFLDNK